MNAEKDMAAGYKHSRCYLCRHCGERITIHNRQWEHTGRKIDFLGSSCVKPGSGCSGKKGQPVPFGTVHGFDEEQVPRETCSEQSGIVPVVTFCD